MVLKAYSKRILFTSKKVAFTMANRFSLEYDISRFDGGNFKNLNDLTEFLKKFLVHLESDLFFLQSIKRNTRRKVISLHHIEIAVH